MQLDRRLKAGFALVKVFEQLAVLLLRRLAQLQRLMQEVGDLLEVCLAQPAKKARCS
jgi:hypothetical protein